MATYEYKARTREGEIRSGIIQTTSKEAALDALQQNSLIVISVEEQKPPFRIDLKNIFSHVSQKDVVIFSRQLSTLFEAHIPIFESLKTLIGESTKPTLRKAILQILDDVGGGLSLSQAMGKHPRIFSPFYINLVRSGEESGKLQETFTYLADYLDRSYYLLTKARNAMIYPAFILFAFMGVIVVMLVVVIPKLLDIFKDTGQTMPFYTQVVIYASLGLRKWGIFLLIFVVGGAAFIWRWSLSVSGKIFFDSLQISVPIVGNLYRKLYMARLTDNLQTLIVSGIPIIRALEITADVVGNVVYRKAVLDAIEVVKAGGTISSAFEKHKEIPVLVTQMMKIGETSGRLDFILKNIAHFYQREVDSLVDNLVALIEPALIIFLGAGVGLLVASVMVPLYNLVGSI